MPRTGQYNNDGSLDLFHVLGTNFYLNKNDGNGNLLPNNEPFTYGNGGEPSFDFTTADMTGDGLTDIIATGSAGLKIYRNLGTDFFTQMYSAGLTGLRPCVQAIDVNGDGRRDLIFGINDTGVEQIGVLIRNADGSFQSIKRTTLGAPDSSAVPSQIRAGFFDTDNILDLAVLESNPSTAFVSRVETLIGTGSGNYVLRGRFDAGINIGGIAVGDFDIDGRSDIAAASSSYPSTGNVTSFYILRTRLDGSVVYSVGTSSNTSVDQIDSGDFNNDGAADIIVREAATKKLKVYLSKGVRQNSLRGSVWYDNNQNQVRDSNEFGVSNQIVYVDANDNGFRDANEASAATLPDGRWEIQTLVNGTHRVRWDRPVGWLQTSPYSVESQLAVPRFATVSNGQIANGLDFGIYDAGDIQGRVYNDGNADNFREPFESGLQGWSVFLDNNNNGIADPGEPNSFTDADGRYKFNVSTSKIYTVRVLPMSGWTATFGASRSVQAGPSATNAIANIGFTRPATVSGRVYYDFAANGREDESEDVGVGGLQVFLDSNNNGVLDAGEPKTTSSTSSTASQTGRYSFTGLFPGNYNVRVVKPTGYQQVSPPPAGSTGTAGPFKVFAFGGADTSYTDFGLIRPVLVSGRAYRDSNANGVINTGETGLSGVGVFIDYNNNGVGDTNEPYVLTDSNGNYTLTSTRQGTFNVRAIRRSGFNSTVPSSSLYSVVFTYGAATTTGKNFGFREGAFNTSPFQSPINIATGSNPTALAAGDFNGDGKQDFIVASNSSISQVYLGQGNGLFTAGQQLSIGDSTRYMIAVDVSGDGKPDLVAANEAFDFGASVLISNGNGTFKNAVNYAVTTNTYGVAAADFNGDGKKDLAYVGTTDNRVAILINKGTGAFNNATFVTNTGSFGGKSVIAGDVNGDGKQDLVVGNNSNDSLSVFLGAGNGTFTKFATNVTGGIDLPNFVTLADFNKDGKLDVAVLNELAENIRVKLGNGNGTFASGQSFPTGPTPTQVAVLDIDRDGNLDLIASCRSDGTTDISGDVSIHRGRGDGTFVDRQIRTAHSSPTAVAIADYNGDGKLDIVAANFFSDDVSMLINGTPGALGAVSGIVWNDADNDGVLDSGESRLGGQSVFADTDNDGVYDPGERITKTASKGDYAFTDLPAGTYRIRVVIPADFVETSPANRAANSVTIAAGQSLSGKNIGLVSILQTDGSYVFDDRSTQLTGSWTRTTGTGQYGGDYLHDGNASKGSKTVRFDLKLPTAGYYAVAVRWVAASNRADNVPIDIKPATNTRTVVVNQKLNGGTWVDLGTYQFNTTGGTVTIRTTGTNGFVVADAVRLVPVATPATYVKDNADASGIVKTGTWITATSPAGFNGTNYLHDGNPATKGGRSVKFTPTVANGGTYEIFGRWVAGADRATNARYDIVTATGIKTVFANQRNSGGQWVSLGFFDVNPATISVTIRNDGANGLVVADAVRFVRVV